MKLSHTLSQDFSGIDKKLIMPFAHKTIVISGATGFIGSLMTRFLLWANDTYSTSITVVAAIRNEKKLADIIPDYQSRSDLHVELVDFSQPADPLEVPFDFLIHTAAITTSALMTRYPVSIVDISLNGTRWALESCRMNSQARLLYLSSMEVYGSFSDGRLVTEDSLGSIDLNAVRSCYPESKRMCELLCTLYNSEFHTDAIIARLAQTFGAGILPGENRVFKQFAESAMNGNSIVLHTDGMSDGNYVYSADALRAMLILLHHGEKGEAYNVANEECHTTIRDMAYMVVDTFGTPGMKLIIEAQDASRFGYAAPTKMKLSSEKLRRLGWAPHKDLEASYRSLIQYMKEMSFEN